MACEGKKKAIVRWTWEGEAEKTFTSRKPGVEVQLTPTSGGAVGHWGVKNASGTVIFDFYSTSYNLLTGFTYERVPRAGNWLLEIRGLQGGNTNSQVVFAESVAVVPLADAGCIFIINDSTGEAFREEKSGKCPSYEIACDDDCPPHHQKCEHPRYPGYCCIPCASTAARINAIAKAIK